MAKRKTGTAAKLVRWHLGIPIEAVGKEIAAALHRIAAQMERDHALKAAEVDLRREHLLNVLESKAMADRAAQKLMGLIPETRSMRVHDLKDCRCTETDGNDCSIPFHQSVQGPDWIKDVLADANVHTEKQS